MKLFYDPRDDSVLEKRGSRLHYWLDDLGAKPVDEAARDEEGFLFAGAWPISDYRRLVGKLPELRDRPEEREPLLRLDSVLGALEQAGIDLPMPRTWQLIVDDPLPEDLNFPLFVRTAETSWKLGGTISKVRNAKELEAEASALRRVFGWDAVVLAREWVDLAMAGQGRHGPIPKEVRVWVVDGIPCAWSFHYMNVVDSPTLRLCSNEDLTTLEQYARSVGGVFQSRLVAADFAKATDGRWVLIEAGPGSCAVTDHEAVFKGVASRLMGQAENLEGDSLGGPLGSTFIDGSEATPDTGGQA